MLTEDGENLIPCNMEIVFIGKANLVEEKNYCFRGGEYIVCSDGKILSTKNIGRGKYRKELKQRINADGYPCVTLGDNEHRTVKRVHRIIAEAFIPNPYSLPEVDHIDNNKTNNDVSNLRWVTGFENKSRIPFEVRSASHKHERNGRSTITAEIAKKIREEYQWNKSIKQLAEKFQTSQGIVGNIVHNVTWKGI